MSAHLYRFKNILQLTERLECLKLIFHLNMLHNTYRKTKIYYSFMINLAYCELYRKQNAARKHARQSWRGNKQKRFQVTLKHLNNIFTNANKIKTFVPLNLYNTKLHSSKIVFWNSFDKTVGHKVSQNYAMINMLKRNSLAKLPVNQGSHFLKYKVMFIICRVMLKLLLKTP